MTVFVDTSALYAFLVATEVSHRPVLDAFRVLAEGGRSLRTTSYVLVETTALLQHRLGLAPVHDLTTRLQPLLSVVWVDRTLHERAQRRLLREDRRRLSFVDCVSLECMALEGICQALTLDRHFAEAGFEMLPRPG